MAVNNVEFHFESLTENVIFHFNRFATFSTKCDTQKKSGTKENRVSSVIYFVRISNEKWKCDLTICIWRFCCDRNNSSSQTIKRYIQITNICLSLLNRFIFPIPACGASNHLKLNQERIYFNTSFQWSLLPFQWTTKSVVVLIADVLEIDSKRRCRRFNMQSQTTPSSKFILKMGNIWRNVLESRENKKWMKTETIRVFFYSGRRLQIVKCVHLSVFIVFRY